MPQCLSMHPERLRTEAMSVASQQCIIIESLSPLSKPYSWSVKQRRRKWILLTCLEYASDGETKTFNKRSTYLCRKYRASQPKGIFF